METMDQRVQCRAFGGGRYFCTRKQVLLYQYAVAMYTVEAVAAAAAAAAAAAPSAPSASGLRRTYADVCVYIC